jgi:hypothetical protein
LNERGVAHGAGQAEHENGSDYDPAHRMFLSDGFEDLSEYVYSLAEVAEKKQPEESRQEQEMEERR